MIRFHFGFILLIILVLHSCRSSYIKKYTTEIPLEAWSTTVFDLMDREAFTHVQECPDLESIDFYKSLIRQTDINNKIAVLDSLGRASKHFDKNSEFALVENCQQGFNFWQCTSYLIANPKTNKVLGFDSCKIMIYPCSKTEIPDYSTKPIDSDYEYLRSFLESTTNCNRDGFFIITLLDKDLNIKRIHVALMP